MITLKWIFASVLLMWCFASFGITLRQMLMLIMILLGAAVHIEQINPLTANDNFALKKNS